MIGFAMPAATGLCTPVAPGAPLMLPMEALA